MKNSVLFILPNDILGGAENVLKISATTLQQKEYRINILFLKESVSGAWDDLSPSMELHFSKHKKERQSLATLPSRIKVASKNNLKYTFSSNTGINGILGILRKFGFLKTQYLIVRESTQLLDRFGGLKGLIFKSLYKLGYPQADLVICQTNYMKERLLATVPSAKNWQIKVIPNPIDIDDLMTKKSLALEASFISKKPFILGVGRLIKLKGFDLLIQAFSKLDEKYNLVILGDGQEKEDLEKMASDLNISDRVYFTGFVKNPFPYMKLAKMCVVSSRLEGFPNTLLQMMALNERVVSTLCAGDIGKLKGVVTCQINSEHGLLNAMQIALKTKNEDLKEIRSNFDLELKSRTPTSFVDTIISTLESNCNV